MGFGINHIGPLDLDHMTSNIEHMGQIMEFIGSDI
jgi:hypothetical protein